MGFLKSLKGNGEFFCEPEDGCDIGDISDDVDGSPAAIGVFHGMLSDELRNVGSEEFGDIGLEAVFEEGRVKDVRAIVMTLCVVPPNHEIVTVCAVANGFLVHDAEVLAIFKDSLAAIECVDTNDIHTTRWPVQVVVLDSLVLFQDLLGCLGSVEWKQCIT